MKLTNFNSIFVKPSKFHNVVLTAEFSLFDVSFGYLTYSAIAEVTTRTTTRQNKFNKINCMIIMGWMKNKKIV